MATCSAVQSRHLLLYVFLLLLGLSGQVVDGEAADGPDAVVLTQPVLEVRSLFCWGGVGAGAGRAETRDRGAGVGADALRAAAVGPLGEEAKEPKLNLGGKRRRRQGRPQPARHAAP